MCHTYMFGNIYTILKLQCTIPGPYTSNGGNNTKGEVSCVRCCVPLYRNTVQYSIVKTHNKHTKWKI